MSIQVSQDFLKHDPLFWQRFKSCLASALPEGWTVNVRHVSWREFMAAGDHHARYSTLYVHTAMADASAKVCTVLVVVYGGGDRIAPGEMAASVVKEILIEAWGGREKRQIGSTTD